MISKNTDREGDGDQREREQQMSKNAAGKSSPG
jgi:hypothetical protein